MASRTVRTPFGEWWWTVDRLTLAALLGADARRHHPVAGGEPAGRGAARPRRLPFRQPPRLVPRAAIAVLLGDLVPVAAPDPALALVVFLVSLVLVAATPFFGAEIKGARRWLVILGVNIQPSEFLKPAFVILIAWLFGEFARRPEMPANTVALALLLLVVTLLVLQPDFGQTMLIALVWGALFFMAGMRLIWVVGLAGVAGGRPGRRLFHRAARRAAHQALPRPGLRRHLQHRHRARDASCAAAGSAAVRARAPSSASCPKATPTSCSPWRRRSSASCSAWCWWRCSPSS